jgi:hypothetical protein
MILASGCTPSIDSSWVRGPSALGFVSSKFNHCVIVPEFRLLSSVQSRFDGLDRLLQCNEGLCCRVHTVRFIGRS